jgi:hypothetical protein
MLLHFLELALDTPDQRLPKPSEGKLSIGMLDVDVEDGHDLRVRLCARKAADWASPFNEAAGANGNRGGGNITPGLEHPRPSDKGVVDTFILRFMFLP